MRGVWHTLGKLLRRRPHTRLRLRMIIILNLVGGGVARCCEYSLTPLLAGGGTPETETRTYPHLTASNCAIKNEHDSEVPHTARANEVLIQIPPIKNFSGKF